jgi:hypothetical protein
MRCKQPSRAKKAGMVNENSRFPASIGRRAKLQRSYTSETSIHRRELYGWFTLFTNFILFGSGSLASGAYFVKFRKANYGNYYANED